MGPRHRAARSRGPGETEEAPRGGMSTLQADVVVLGAGMVGVSVAVHLQKRGRQVVMIDRRHPGEETSYGNGGLVQREAGFSPPFSPSGARVRRLPRNPSGGAHYHLSALPGRTGERPVGEKG